MHSRAANEEALICLRAPERASTNGLLWPCWCQLGCHSFPSLILGMSKYLEKSRSSNEYRNLNLPKSRSQRKERRALHCPFAVIVDCISARNGGYGPHLPNAKELGRLAVLSQPAPQQPKAPVFHRHQHQQGNQTCIAKATQVIFRRSSHALTAVQPSTAVALAGACLRVRSPHPLLFRPLKHNNSEAASLPRTERLPSCTRLKWLRTPWLRCASLHVSTFKSSL